MQHRVPLPKLPDGLEFPAHLRERIEYDAERHELSFRGFMTKYTYDELTQLAKDVPYRDALERLFVFSSEEVQPPAARRIPFAAIIVGAASLLVLAAVIFWAAFLRPASGPVGSPAEMHAAQR